MNSYVLRFVYLLIGWGTCCVSIAADLEFNRDIRPILSDRCYHCHGPDSATQEAGLRLDSREEAEGVIDSGDFWDRITSDDPDYQMPPPDSKLSLSKAERTVLEKWLKAGAEYKKHWAFEPLPVVVELPTESQDAWCKSPLDGFILHRMREAGLSPSQPASPLRWLRRVTLDLNGLPPTLNEIREFEAKLTKAVSSSEEAVEDVYDETVELLLDREALGEHMAVSWLDAARYADSYGYQSDKLNTQWPYRDWVVKAINANLAYDDFLVWQLAGDLLPSPTRDQLVATAFNRIHRLNNEGGAVFEEWRLENVADRVHTFGTAMLGLTLECARCHDHKYDPLPTRDYYSLSAFFNSIDESGVYDRRQKVPCPSILLPTKEQEIALENARREVEALEVELAAEIEKSKSRFKSWKADSNSSALEIPDLILALGFDKEFDNSLKEIYHPSESDRSWTTMPELVPVIDSNLPRMPFDEAADHADSDSERTALSLDGERGVTTKGVEPLDRWTPFAFVVSLKETKRSKERSLIAHHTRGTDCGYNGWDLTIVDGYLESRMYRVWPGNAIGIRTRSPIPKDRWQQIAATYDGSSRAAGLKLYLNGEPLPVEILRDNVKKSANVKVDHGGEFVIGQRFRARGLDGGLIDDVRLYARSLTQVELKCLASGNFPSVTAAYYASAVDLKCRTISKELTEARRKLVMAEEAMDEIPVMDEMEKPRPAHVLARGQYDAPTDESTLVDRTVPSALGLPLAAGETANRLDLAKWLIHPDHPLTGRVAVNRLWGNFFAEPLVATPENFGSQGTLPTHPELLDWLSRDFIQNGWDVKRFCKQVVLSSTYRQDSVSTKQQLEVDPENRLLSLGPKHRLTAEQIRDLALAASGLLNPDLGGPPVSPYQPGKDLWRESNGMSPSYQQSVGQSLYRRSLYSVWKRTVPLPNMLAFDAGTREVCSVKRSRTNTPLQALVLMNDVQFVEASRKLAERIYLLEQEDGPRINAAFAALAGRQPDDGELKALRTLLAQEKEWFAEHQQETHDLLSLGDSETDASVDMSELAALTTVCNAILNLDATVWKR